MGRESSVILTETQTQTYRDTHAHALTQIYTQMQIETHSLALTHAERGMSTAVTSCFLALETLARLSWGSQGRQGVGGWRGGLVVCLCEFVCVDMGVVWWSH